MQDQCMHDSIDAFIKRNPSARRVFDSLGIDYCCGGSRTLEEACRAGGHDPERVARLLGETGTAGREAPRVTASGIAELADRIEREHHDRLKEELPRLEALARKVARVHGPADPRLVEVHDRFRAFAEEMAMHMEKEERIPQGGHAGAEEALKTLRALTGDFNPPDWACGTYRALLAGLLDLEADMAVHVRKEEDLLFPRALALEGRGGT